MATLLPLGCSRQLNAKTRNVYANKLNNRDIKFPKKATVECYEIKYDGAREHIERCIQQTHILQTPFKEVGTYTLLGPCWLYFCILVMINTQ